MRATTGVLAVMLMLVAAVPGTAFAQSAGDEQYVDPFQEPPADSGGGQGGESQGGSPGGSTGGGGGSATGAPAPADEQTVPPATEAAPSTTTSPTTGSSAVLPRTGLPFAPVAGVGLLLVVGGVALRRRT